MHFCPFRCQWAFALSSTETTNAMYKKFLIHCTTEIKIKASSRQCDSHTSVYLPRSKPVLAPQTSRSGATTPAATRAPRFSYSMVSPPDQWLFPDHQPRLTVTRSGANTPKLCSRYPAIRHSFLRAGPSYDDNFALFWSTTTKYAHCQTL